MESEDRRGAEHRPGYSGSNGGNPPSVLDDEDILSWALPISMFLTSVIGIGALLSYSGISHFLQKSRGPNWDQAKSSQELRVSISDGLTEEEFYRRTYYRLGDKNMIRYLEDTNAVPDGIPDRKVEIKEGPYDRTRTYSECSSNDIRDAQAHKTYVFH
jgi:hypothetical protein